LCFHHQVFFLSRYESFQKFCCDPFRVHKKHVTKSLRIADATLAEKLQIKPGQKLCKACQQRAKVDDEDSASASGEEYQPESCSVAELNESMSAIGGTPLKTVSERDKVGYAKGKIRRMHVAMKSKLAEALTIPTESLDSSTEPECAGCSDLNELVSLLKEKCKVSSRQEQVRILTLTPPSWSIQKTADEFSVSNHLVKKGRELKQKIGILASPAMKRGRKLDDSTVKMLIQFYNNDEYSRICPGKKDFVSIKQSSGVRLHEQKRLVLVNLKELHLEFVKTTGIHLGFSTFCSLRPKSCVTVGSSGSHSVCVCEQHQNAKLLLAALPGPLHYKELLNIMVCSVEERQCMLRECDMCPGREGVVDYLTKLFDDADMDLDDSVEFKQWVHTDRTTLTNISMAVEGFVEHVAESFDNLRQHHFIAKAQSSHLQASKSLIQDGTVIVLLDFAENYSFVVQDAVQGHHWNNSQASLHPFAVYHQTGSSCECQSYCVVSDSLQHNATAVHAFMTVLVQNLKQQLPKLTLIKYYSDGAASQYKNFKNLINLYHHLQDFGIPAEWHFFATSHGKSPCDGIGGTVKRLVARASLQATSDGQILTPVDLYGWAKEHISGITFYYVSTDDIIQHEARLQLPERYASVKTIPGTRSHHTFIPCNDGTLIMKRISSDELHSRIVLYEAQAQTRQSDVVVNSGAFQPGTYIACVYDNNWYIGNIVERSDTNSDVLVTFMKRADTKLSWPRRDDKCWVPFQHIICTVDAPQPVSHAARQYEISAEELKRVEKHCHNLYCFD